MLKSDHKSMTIFLTEIRKALQLIFNSPYINMEEFKLEDDNKVTQQSESEKSEDDNTVTVKERFVHFLNVMTIEPMMFLQSLGWSITSIAQSQMILYKTCRGRMYLVFLYAREILILYESSYQSLQYLQTFFLIETMSFFRFFFCKIPATLFSKYKNILRGKVQFDYGFLFQY